MLTFKTGNYCLTPRNGAIMQSDPYKHRRGRRGAQDRYHMPHTRRMRNAQIKIRNSRPPIAPVKAPVEPPEEMPL